MKKILIFLLTALFIPAFSGAKNSVQDTIPDSLKEWQKWVLHDKKTEVLCTPAYNNGEQFFCAWPGTLKLELDNIGGRFIQKWEIDKEQSIPLPGDIVYWPTHVTVNGEKAATMSHENMPVLFVPKGSLVISGQFAWQAIPEYLQIPAQSALIDLSINNTKVPRIDLSRDGRLWLKSQKTAVKKDEDRITLNVFRKINDTIPPHIDLRLDILVSGAPREIDLGQIFPAESFVPVSITSSLPARVDQDGSLRLQVRPGSWLISLTIRKKKEMRKLSFQFPQNKQWPANEIWVFQSQPSLRVVKIEGVPSIDPNQTTLPQAWKNMPAYFVKSADTMIFSEIKRGDPNPVPDQLTLNRNLWLRFDGSGYTVNDKISGEKNNNWRFEALSKLLRFGRVTIDGQEQFITKRSETGLPGVEMRKGVVNMEIDSTIDGSISALPAHGYDTTFHKVTSTLHLPPGYKLLAVSNADNAYPTWLKKWNLLNLFILLITTIAAVRLFNLQIGLLTFTTLLLIFHEPGNPPLYSWLHLFAALALLKVVPEGRIRRIISLYKAFVLIGIVLLSIPFMINQIRTALYPQLEKSNYFRVSGQPQAPVSQPQEVDLSTPKALLYKSAERTMAQSSPLGGIAPSPEQKMSAYQKQSSILQQDPATITQTGPGLPDWQWNPVHMSWNGPVSGNHDIGLVLLTPKVNRVLGFVKCILLFLLFFMVCGIQLKKGMRPDFSRLMMTVILCAALTASIFSPGYARAAAFPTPEMLADLQKRLLEQDPCFSTSCADIDSMAITADKTKLSLRLQVHAARSAAVPLPGYLQQWHPENVTITTGKSTTIPPLLRYNESLWAMLPAGIHDITISTQIPQSQSTLQINSVINPHAVSFAMDGWTIEGLDKNNRMDGVVTMKRIPEGGEHQTQEVFETGILPPFFQVERTILLGLNWQTTTVIRRLGPTGSSATLRIPLLSSESITSEGIKLENGRAVINFSPSTTVLSWSSVLDKTSKLTLHHIVTDLWTEIYKVEPSPIWHLEYDGPPVIHHKEGDVWFPQWHLRPSEEVALFITKPAGIKGKTRTITSSALDISPGQSSSDAKLSFQLRSSQGGQHSVKLPENIAIQKLEINGKTFPVQKDDAGLIVPVNPGSQNILVEWRDQSGMKAVYKTPEMDLGTDSVNARITVHLGANRWPLFLWGPQMGPAVLYWSILLVIFLVSFALAKISFVPMKTYQWFLLCIGLSQAEIGAAAMVVLWLLALGARKKLKPDMAKGTFNFIQLCLALLSFASLAILVAAISKGLLGSPDMWISGNNSSNYLLNWYTDRTSTFPQAHIISAPLYVYRVLMLAWALWISFALLRLLRWGWDCFSTNHIWHKVGLKSIKLS
jgi:hypothetical protein